jgi:flagellin
MAWSINTNVAAMQALATFNAINAEMAEVQTRLTTGRRINSAKDNPAIWAIAQNQRGEVRALDSVKASLNRGQSIVSVAMAGAEQVSDLLNDMKALAVSAQDYAVTDPARIAINDNYQALKRQIDITVRNADFNGTNLLAAGGAGQVRALANTSATSTLDVGHEDLSSGGGILGGMPADLLGGLGPGGIDAITTAISGANAALSRLGTGAKALDRHLEFVGKLQDTLEAGIGNLVDADLAREASRFEALKVRQQLAIYAMNIANQQPSLILQLFRQ